MKENFTKIVFLLDKSGSMQSLISDTIGGFNAFLEEQKKLKDEASMTVLFFSNSYEPYRYWVDINDVEPLNTNNYIPSGSTALLDAVGYSIDDVGAKLDTMHEEEKPDKVIFVIMTDGEENASTIFSADEIKEKIEHQQNKYNWQFIFLGCNQDAWLSSKNLGIANYSNVEFSKSGLNNMYTTLSMNMANYRSTGVSNQMPESIK